MKTCIRCGNKEGKYDNNKSMKENLDQYVIPPMKFFKTLEGFDICADCYKEEEKKNTYYKDLGISQLQAKNKLNEFGF